MTLVKENPSLHKTGERDGISLTSFSLIVNRLSTGFPIPRCTYVTHLEILEDDIENKRMPVAHYEGYGLLDEE